MLPKYNDMWKSNNPSTSQLIERRVKRADPPPPWTDRLRLLGHGHEQKHLGHHHRRHQHIRRNHHRHNLGVQLVQPHPARAREARQRVAQRDEALAADNRRLQLPAKRPVKRQDDLLVGAEQRRLHAHQQHLGGHDGRELEDGRDQEDDEALPRGVARELGRAVGVGGQAQAEELGRERGGADGQGLGDPGREDGEAGGFKGALEGGEALVEAEGARGRDDDVGPGGDELGQGQGRQEVADGDPGDGGFEDAAEGGAGEGDDGRQEDAAEVGAPAGDGG